MNDRRGVAGLREAFTCLCGAPGRLLGWRWLGVVLEAGAVFADFDVEVGGGLAGAGDGLPGAALVGTEFGFPLNSQSDGVVAGLAVDRKSTRLNSSHVAISYAVFCLKQKT